MKENNVHRIVSSLIAIGILTTLAVYAEYGVPKKLSELREKEMEVFRSNNGYIYSGGVVIQSVNDRSFTTNWTANTFRKFNLSTNVPFNVGDKVAFKLRLDNGIGHLEEFHIWKSSFQWYIKAILSLIPLSIVGVLLFQQYRFDSSRLMLIRKYR